MKGTSPVSYQGHIGGGACVWVKEISRVQYKLERELLRERGGHSLPYNLVLFPSSR